MTLTDIYIVIEVKNKKLGFQHINATKGHNFTKNVQIAKHQQYAPGH